MTLDLGRMQQSITLQNPTRTADGDGGYTEAWSNLSPPVARASISPATARTLERLTANTIVAQGALVVRMRYHPQVTMRTRIQWTDRTRATRTAQVVDFSDPDEMGVEMVLIVSEVVA